MSIHLWNTSNMIVITMLIVLWHKLIFPVYEDIIFGTVAIDTGLLEAIAKFWFKLNGDSKITGQLNLTPKLERI